MAKLYRARFLFNKFLSKAFQSNTSEYCRINFLPKFQNIYKNLFDKQSYNKNIYKFVNHCLLEEKYNKQSDYVKVQEQNG